MSRPNHESSRWLSMPPFSRSLPFHRSEHWAFLAITCSMNHGKPLLVRAAADSGEEIGSISPVIGSCIYPSCSRPGTSTTWLMGRMILTVGSIESKARLPR